MTVFRIPTAAEALADSLHGLDARIHAPLDAVAALRSEWAESLVERLRARGFEIVPAGQVALSEVGDR